MTLKRVKELADFFSSGASQDIALRIACLTRRFIGFDIERGGFISLFTILNKSRDLKGDLACFVERSHGGQEK